jgi:HEPN domain-containing protein
MDDGKRDLVRSWLLKASHDLRAAHVLARGSELILDAVPFHCQQAAEKALKGFLFLWGLPVEEAFDVGRLLRQAEEVEPGFDSWRHAADRLTPYGMLFDDPFAIEVEDSEQIDEALDDADTIVRQVLAYLPPEVHPEDN